MARSKCKSATLQSVASIDTTGPALEIRYPDLGEVFALSGNAEYYNCLIIDQSSQSRLFLPVEYPALEVIHYAVKEVVFHHAVNDLCEQFALPEIWARDPDSRFNHTDCHKEIFREWRCQWMTIQHLEGHGAVLGGVGMDEDPDPICRHEFSRRLSHSLTPWVIHFPDHPLIDLWAESVSNDPQDQEVA